VAGQDALVTRHEAARLAGVTFNTILLWIRAGRLHPVAEPGRGRRVIRLSEVEAAVVGSERAQHRTMSIWAAGSNTVRSAPPSPA